MPSQDPGLEKCGVWTIHSETRDPDGGRPMLRGFAKSRAEAERIMAELKAGEASSDFWLVELTHNELEDFKAVGMVPPGF